MKIQLNAITALDPEQKEPIKRCTALVVKLNNGMSFTLVDRGDGLEITSEETRSTTCAGLDVRPSHDNVIVVRAVKR